MEKYNTVSQILAEPHAFGGAQVALSGWVRTARSSGPIGFVELNDGSCFASLQLVLQKDALENYAEIAALNTGSSLCVTGTLVLTPQAKQPCEVKVLSAEIVGATPPEYPLQKKRHSFEYLRTIAHLRPRTNTFAAVFRVRSLLSYAIHQFFQQRGFVYVHTPIITTSDCEGAGEMFRVTTMDAKNPPLTDSGAVDYTKDFFGVPASLTVSGQLNGETYAMAFRNIYTFGPTFRAEKSYTARHAAEFWMIEPEMAFCDLGGNMEVAEAMVKFLIEYVLKEAPDEMAFFDKYISNGLIARLNLVKDSEFGRVTYTEAVDLLLKSGRQFQYPVFWGCDLQTEHERYLTEEVFKRPVFVVDYPVEIKAFYMRQNPDGKTVAAMDMLVPGIGELIGGSQREERIDRLERRMKELHLPLDTYDWYLDLRRFGGAVHSGYGLGFERMLMYVTGMENIRDVIPFPRTTGSAMF